jgi:Cd2+/Zn2+-exporting ATPase
MNLLTELTQIGFTEYEAKVYLALLSDNPATGYQLSKTSGVPRSMIYEALSRLHARGAVMESIEDRAALYRPLPPDLLLQQLQEEHLQLIDNLRVGLQKLYNAPTVDRVWSLSGRRPILTYSSQMIRNALSEVFLVLNDDDLLALRDEISATCERGVQTNTLLIGEGELKCGRVVYHPPLESELHGLTGMLLLVVDGAETLIAGKDHDVATITRNAHLVQIARQFVWMEFFTQRIYAQLGKDLLARLDPEDRRIFESLRKQHNLRS